MREVVQFLLHLASWLRALSHVVHSHGSHAGPPKQVLAKHPARGHFEYKDSVTEYWVVC